MKKLWTILFVLIAGLAFGLTQDFVDTSFEASYNIQKFGGTVHYISQDGSDSNTGDTPLVPFLTIGKGITEMGDGDALSIKAGTYTEVGLVLTNNSDNRHTFN